MVPISGTPRGRRNAGSHGIRGRVSESKGFRVTRKGGEGLALASTGGRSQPPHPIHRLTEGTPDQTPYLEKLLAVDASDSHTFLLLHSCCSFLLSGPLASAILRDNERLAAEFSKLHSRFAGNLRALVRRRLRQCFPQDGAAWSCLGWERSTAFAPIARQARSEQM